MPIEGSRRLSHHVSPNGHGLEAVWRPGVLGFREASERHKPGPDDVVDGDVKGAKRGLGRLFGYLRGEMLEKSTKSGPGLEIGLVLAGGSGGGADLVVDEGGGRGEEEEGEELHALADRVTLLAGEFAVAAIVALIVALSGSPSHASSVRLSDLVTARRFRPVRQ